MKKILLIILLCSPLLCNSQSLHIDSAAKTVVYKYEQDSLYSNVQSIHQLIFNITASFQMFSDDSTSVIFRPLIFLDDKVYIEDNYPDIKFKDIEKFEIIKSHNGKFRYGEDNSNISIIIKTKK
ncbi:hypothetical protein GQR60_18575 [Labilibaculum sp. A4]|uniref:hypothetical protein n=1 Tax=Labilibaculum euxinus TaxID=2686357 RepID=UPI000F618138|nr:hypothetical protein [Labilibaculum euxinus]MDQ1772572.1 hypothetical protein [Labilibaculum euxinus]MWN78343.1 hypothetical protein [Labilibaculum euxinus]